jgi:hypothetical protein
VNPPFVVGIPLEVAPVVFVPVVDVLCEPLPLDASLPSTTTGVPSSLLELHARNSRGRKTAGRNLIISWELPFSAHQNHAKSGPGLDWGANSERRV